MLLDEGCVAMPDIQPTTQGAFVIRCTVDLDAVWATPRLIAKRPLLIALPGLSAETARTAAERIAAYGNACGCGWGASAMVAVFGTSSTWLALTYGILTTDFLWRLPLALLCGLAAAGAAKYLAISYTRSRLKREIKKLLASQPSPSASEV